MAIPLRSSAKTVFPGPVASTHLLLHWKRGISGIDYLNLVTISS